MGEATYYGKLRFPSSQAARKALPVFKKFCVECSKAEDFWQRHRDRSYSWNRGYGKFRGKKYATDEEYWDAFEQKFPRVSEYLKQAGDEYNGLPYWRGDRNNGLAGMVEPIGSKEDAQYIELLGTDISWHSTVWHLADWDPMIRFLEKKLGCVGHWLSDEFVDMEFLLETEFR